MSQKLYNSTLAGKPVEVLMGWDEQMQGFFMVVQSDEDEELPTYSNLDDEELIEPRVTQNLLHFRNRLVELGVVVSEEFLASVEFK